MLVFDLETNGLIPELTTIHTLHVHDRAAGVWLRFSDRDYEDGSPAPRDGSVEDGVRLLQDAPVIAGHNIIRFDIPAIQKLYPWFQPTGEIVDTVVDSRLIWTDLNVRDSKAMKRRRRPPEFTGKHVGSHALEAWGYRLGILKGDYSAVKAEEARAMGLTGDEVIRYTWGTFNRAMDDYCRLDVEVTLALLEKIESKDYSLEARRLEVEVTRIVDLQEQHGFYFDIDAAERLTGELMGRRAELEDQLREVFKPWYAPERKHGEHVVMVPKRNDRTRGYMEGVPLTKVELIVFNPSSRDQIADRLQALYGWVPVEMTDGGKPKVDETTLAGVNFPEAKVLIEYLTVDKRLGQIAEGKQAWLKKVAADRRIHGAVNPMGAGSHRGSHRDPNLAQVPKVHKGEDKQPLLGYAGGWGFESRSMFQVPAGRRLVGVDAEGLQLRVLGHYMARFDGGAFSEAVANGDKSKGTDAHTMNQKAIGLNERESAKTFIYAYLLGAGGWKLGSIVYDDFTDRQREAFNAKHPEGEARAEAFVRLGNRAKKRIEDGIPALGAVQKLFREKAKRGWIKSLDGRVVYVPSLHVALAYALQSGEAVIMKRAMVLLWQRAHARGWTWGEFWAQVAWVHDEFQNEVYEPTIAEDFGRMAASCIEDAMGEVLGIGPAIPFHCPLAGDFGIGVNWADTH
jgi:DNA polymerase-1